MYVGRGAMANYVCIDSFNTISKHISSNTISNPFLKTISPFLNKEVIVTPQVDEHG